MRLAGKSAFVTGAASGIGKAVVEALLEEGAHVIAADKDYAGVQGNVNDNPHCVHLDVTQESDWEVLFQGGAKLDVLVACAGISEARPILETNLSDWRRVMAVNLDGAFLSVKYGAKAIHGSHAGAIVLVGSASGIKAASGAGAYSTSKAALRMLTKVAALELKDQAIRVNCVSPAAVATPMWQKMPFLGSLVQKHGSELGAWKELGGIDPATPSIKRMAFPEEVAKIIVFLSSDESGHITGEELVVDGGYTLT